MEIKSAQFYTVTRGLDRALTAALGQTPNLVNLNPYASHQTVGQWVNDKGERDDETLIKVK